LPLRADSDEIVLLHDRHAWVGLPIDYQTTAETEAWKKAKIPNNVKNMIANSPYKQRLLSEEQRKSLSPSKKAQHQQQPSSSSSASVVLSKSRNERKTLYNEKEQLAVMKSIGYTDEKERMIRLPGMPRIGSQEYDPMTGHLLVYRGNGKWKRVMDDTYVSNFGRDHYDPQENLPLQTMDSIYSEEESMILAPDIRERRSGVIQVRNKQFQAKKPLNQENYQNLFSASAEHEVNESILLSSNHYHSNSDLQQSKSEILTTNRIVNSFLTNVQDMSQETDNDSYQKRETNRLLSGNDYHQKVKKDLHYNEKTGTPYRGAQKVPYLSQQLKAVKQQREEEENLSLGRISKKKTKKNTEIGNDEKLTWTHTKGSVESLNNDLISKNPQLTAQLMNLMYSTDKPNDTLFNSLFEGENSALLRSYLRESNAEATNNNSAEIPYGLPSLSPSKSSILRQEISQALLESTYHEGDELENVWKRSLYVKPKEISSKVVVWQRPVPQHYHLKYTWIPQPLVHNAVHEVFYDRSHRDLKKETKESMKPQHETVQEKERKLKEQLISIVSPPPVEKPMNEPSMEDFPNYFYETGNTLEEGSQVSSVSSNASPVMERKSGLFYDPETRSILSRADGPGKPLKKKAGSITFLSDSLQQLEEQKQQEKERKRVRRQESHENSVDNGEEGGDEAVSFLSESQRQFSALSQRSKSSWHSQSSQRSLMTTEDINSRSNNNNETREKKATNRRSRSMNEMESKEMEEEFMNQQQDPSLSGLSIQHNLSSNSITFPKFMKTWKPRELTKGQRILQSSIETVQYQKETKNRKFRYKPVGSKYAQITPTHPFEFR
jgi:hypothetical protein